MHAFIAFILLFASLTLLVVEAGAPPAALIHASGNMPALGGTGALPRAAWLAGALAAVRRLRSAAARRE